MNILELKTIARERMKGFCILCPQCNGNYCSGKVPGMGGTGDSESFKDNFRALQEVKIKMKTIHEAKDPEIKFDFFETQLQLPLMSAPITGSDINFGGYLKEDEYIKAVVEGSSLANTLAMIGDSGKKEYYEYGIESIKNNNGNGIAIIKPRENKEIIKKIRMAEEVGAKAVGIDIDGAGLLTMKLYGQPVGPKTFKELQELRKSTKLPFILKGIMTLEEAKMALEIGMDAIVVSNHGGRVLDHTPGVARVLPEIAKELKGKIMIMADGNVRTGMDMFKYIALGADMVLIGRPVIWGAVANEAEGVNNYIDYIKQDFYKTMILTGCQKVSDIGEQNLYR